MVDERILALKGELNRKKMAKARLNMEIREIRNRIFRIKYGSKSRRRGKRSGAPMTEAKRELNPRTPVDSDDENGAAVEVDGDKK